MSATRTVKSDLMTKYEFNQLAYETAKPISHDKAKEMFTNIGMWFSSKSSFKYFMLLCRELNDYTVFDFQSYNYAKGKEELVNLLAHRGRLLDIEYDHTTDSYEIWVRAKSDKKPHMYKLFDCNDFVIQIGNE